MAFCRLSTPAELQTYREWLKNAPGASLWQSLEWEGYQRALGRETRLYGLKKAVGSKQQAVSNSSHTAYCILHTAPQKGEFLATALVVIDRTAFGLSTWDIPRGPLASNTEAAAELLGSVVSEAKREGAMAVYCSPSEKFLASSVESFVPSARHEQPEATIVLDLTLPEDALLAQMKPKGRYNISVAEKHGVQINTSDDIEGFHALLGQTAERDGFRVKSKKQYQLFLEKLPGSFLLLAYARTQDGGQGTKVPVAGLLGVIWQNRGYYYYGASSYAHRAVMAPYLLQWEAIRLCKDRGCTIYDLLGIAPLEEDSEEADRTHPWAGVTRFKQQFGGTVITYSPEQAMILRPLPKFLLDCKRKIIG